MGFIGRAQNLHFNKTVGGATVCILNYPMLTLPQLPQLLGAYGGWVLLAHHPALWFSAEVRSFSLVEVF